MTDVLWAAVIVAASVLYGAAIVADAVRKVPRVNLRGIEESLEHLRPAQSSTGFWAEEAIKAAYDIAGKDRPQRESPLAGFFAQKSSNDPKDEISGSEANE